MSNPQYPRRFVGANETLDSWPKIEPYFEKLEKREVGAPAEVERWLEDYSELMACLDEVGTDRHVKMTCQTDDPARKAAYFDFLENIEPNVKPRIHALNVKYTKMAAAKELLGRPSPRPLPKEGEGKGGVSARTHQFESGHGGASLGHATRAGDEGMASKGLASGQLGASASSAGRYAVLDRRIRASVETFREKNVPLQTQEAKLMQEFQEIGGAQTVSFDGREQTVAQLAVYAERTDRAVRQGAWEAEANRRLQDVDKLEEIFDQLIKLRHEMALNTGCANYVDYAFKSMQRFDYTPQDCFAFHAAVERAAVPVLRALQCERESELRANGKSPSPQPVGLSSWSPSVQRGEGVKRDAVGFDKLRPWDLAVDVKGRAPLKPFADVEELCAKCSRVFHRVDAELGAQFDEMRAKGYLDLANRKGKAPGGYQSNYEESRRPFIFMNAVGVQRDVRVLVHEGGHAFHSVAARHDPLIQYRSAPIEFCEVASFGMEMLALDYLDEFYDADEFARAKRAQLEGIIYLIPWVATIDAFQQQLYAKPGHSRDERRAMWLELHRRFGGVADFSGYERALAYAWQKQVHLFQAPLYYIEYGIAKLGALQVWRNAMKDRAGATKAYRAGLALGGSRPLPELFAAAGAKFDFSYETLAPLMDAIEKELAVIPS